MTFISTELKELVFQPFLLQIHLLFQLLNCEFLFKIYTFFKNVIET